MEGSEEGDRARTDSHAWRSSARLGGSPRGGCRTAGFRLAAGGVSRLRPASRCRAGGAGGGADRAVLATNAALLAGLRRPLPGGSLPSGPILRSLPRSAPAAGRDGVGRAAARFPAHARGRIRIGGRPGRALDGAGCLGPSRGHGGRRDCRIPRRASAALAPGGACLFAPGREPARSRASVRIPRDLRLGRGPGRPRPVSAPEPGWQVSLAASPPGPLRCASAPRRAGRR